MATRWTEKARIRGIMEKATREPGFENRPASTLRAAVAWVLNLG